MQNNGKVTVTLGFKSNFTHFLYTQTKENSNASTKYFSGEVNAFITNGKYKGRSKVYKNEEGVLKIQSYEKGENGEIKENYPKAMVTFNIIEGDFFIPPKSIQFKFNGECKLVRPGEKIQFGTEAKPKIAKSKF